MSGTITVTATGAFTGKVDLGSMATATMGDGSSGMHVFGESVLTPIAGQFNAGGRARLTLVQQKRFDYIYREYLDLRFEDSETPVISGVYSYVDRLLGDTLGYFSAHKVAPAGTLAGRYNMVLRTVPQSESDPSGNGWAIISVKPNGGFIARGRVGTGRPFLMSSLMRAGGEVWFDADRRYSHSFYQSSAGWSTIESVQEYLHGLLMVRGDSDVSDIEGELRWDQNGVYANQDRLKFEQRATVMASRYSRPASGELIFGQPEGAPPGSTVPIEVSLTGDGLAAAQYAGFTLKARSFRQVAQNLSEPLATIQFNSLDGTTATAADGTFRGTVQFAGESIPRNFSGIILQKQNIGFGFFKGAAGKPLVTGSLSMAPEAPPATAQ